jgi:hypothetical protein
MGTLPKERYETVPYMMAPQARIPDVLLTSLGVTQTPGLAYVRLPFKRRPGSLPCFVECGTQEARTLQA